MQPYFFPYIGYFQLIHAVDIYVNMDHVSFMKRSYMTRNTLKDNTAFNVNVWNGSQNKSCDEVMVNFSQDYTNTLLKKINHFYAKSPHYSNILEKIILPEFIEREISIAQFNISIIKRVCNYLDIHTKIIETSTQFENLDLKREAGLKSITKQLNGTDYINAIGGQALYSKEDFRENGINLHFLKMGDVGFDDPYASILDLMFRYDKEYLIRELKKYTLI